MADASDMDLLQEYARSGSEDAFAELVRRHVNLVYSAALRQVGIAAQAEEITQAVFIILTRKAGSLRPNTVLEGWLFETARLTSLGFLRGERRRQFREQEAYMQSTLREHADDPTWREFAPVLDEAISQLGRKDRDAVILRFFKNRSVRDVAVTLDVSEAAAQRRVHRAMGKLRKFFARRGVSSTTAIIEQNISAHSVQIAPAALAKTVAAVAVAKGATASVSTLTLIEGALKIMAWTKAKTAIAVGVGILLVAGTGTLSEKVIEAHKTYPWQVPKADFGVFYKMPAAVKIVPSKFSKSGGRCTDSGRGAMGIAQPLETIVQVAYGHNNLQTVLETDLPKDKYDFIAKLVGPQEAGKNTPVDENWRVALQNEIRKRFGITGSLEMRETNVLVLKPLNTGARGFTVSHSMPRGIAISEKKGDFSFHEQPISTLLGVIQRYIQVPVVDQTGLAGPYDYTLSWDEPDPKQPNLDGLKNALADQLGLELVPTNAPIEMLVIQKAK